MSEAAGGGESPGRKFITATWTEVQANLAGGFVAYVVSLGIAWVASRSSRLFAGLFPAVWDFLTSPVAVPLGLLLVGALFGGMTLLVFLLLFKSRGGASRTLRGTALSGAIVALGVAGLGMGLYAFRDREPRRPRAFKRLTSAGNVAQAAVSPEGKFFAYVADHGDGRQSLHLGQVGEADAAVTMAEPEAGRYGELAFAPDGLSLYFARYGCSSTAGALYRMATPGGQPVVVKDGLPRFFSYSLSPDGRAVAFTRNLTQTDESVLVAAPVSPPGEERVVARRKMSEPFLGAPAWSPDGESLSCSVWDAGRRRAQLARVRVETGEQRLSNDLGDEFVLRVASLPGEGELVLSASRIYGPYRILRVPHPGGGPEQVTYEVNNYDGMSLTADARDLVTVEDTLANDLWVAPAGQPDRAQPLRHTAGKHNDYWGFSWTDDGRVLYVSAAGGGQNIWVMNADGTGRRPLTHEGDNIDPCATAGPDGRRYVVYTSKRAGSYNIWRMDADGAGRPVQLTRGGRDFAPHCSRDGRVVYTSEQKGEWRVWTVGVEGGEPSELTRRPSQWPAVAPDGRVAFFYVDEQSVMKIGVLPPGGGAVRSYDLPCTASTWAELRWVRGGQELTYVDTQDGVSNIWSLPLSGGPARRLTRFTEGRIFRYDWSADDRLILSHGSVRRDVVRITFGGRGGGAGG
ncbi:MAG TPA: hypothetical protein VF668_07585 [Pyrinomonadaceae bacterium]|jgi:Tol biopolymer transport system component